MKSRLIIALLLLLQFNAQGQTSTVSRLVSVGRDAFTNGAMMPLDSTQYFTSGNNICDLELGYQNDSSYVFTWYPNNGGYKLTMRTVNVLSPDGYQSSLQQNGYVNSNGLENAYVHNYTYLPNGGVMDTLLQWNSNAHRWDYMQLCADTFYDHKHIRVHNYATWYNGAWSLNSRTQHTYTAAGDPDTLLDLGWDAVAAQWTPSYLMKYSYDSANRLVSQTFQSWQVSTGTWLPISLTTTTYNAAGDTAIQQMFQWDNASNSWVKNARHILVYNNSGKLTADIQQFWLSNTQSFMNWSRTLYTYNSYGQAATMSSERWNILDSAFEFGLQSMRTRYHYEEYIPVLGVAQTRPEPSIMLYPNPGRDYVWLDWKGSGATTVAIQLTDMQGRPVYQLQKTASELHQAIPTQQLPAASYILQFVADGRQTQRILQVVH